MSPLTDAERRELHELRRRADLLERLGETVAVCDAATLAITYWNRGAECMLGWSPEEALGRTPAELLRSRYPETTREEVFAVLAREGQAEARVEVTTRSGEHRMLASSWRLEPGPPAEIIIIARDITREVRAEREQRRTEARFRAFMDHLPAAAFVKDASQRLIYVNPHFERDFATRLAQVQGLTHVPHLPTGMMERMLELDRLVLATGRPQVATDGITEADGRRQTWQITKFLIPDEEEPLTGGLAFDVSDFQRTQEQLERLGGYKDEFLSVVSHELRTPLNFIMGFASILAEGIGGQLPPAQQEHVDRILQGAERMLVLINNLLDMSRLASGQLGVAPALTEVAPLFDEVLRSMEPLAREQRLGLEARIDAPGRFMLDGPRLVQILMNLVGNAIKFTPPGGQITVTARRVAAGLHVAVQDSGPGIAPEERERLFQRFSQLETTPRPHEAGTGLGLAISKALVEAHGGTIGVDSTPGAGACFWFTLPSA